MSLYDVMGLSDKPLKKVVVDIDLARKILKQSCNLSIKAIAKICKCTTAEVRAVYWEENKWRAKLKKIKEESSLADKNTLALKEKCPTLEALLKSKEGKSVRQWVTENGMDSHYFYALKKEYEKGQPSKPMPDLAPKEKAEALAALEQLKGLVADREPDNTPELEHQEPDSQQTKPETGLKPDKYLHNPGAILVWTDNSDQEKFPSKAAALEYMENNLSKKDAQKVDLYEVEYKKVPFSFGVMVTSGETAGS